MTYVPNRLKQLAKTLACAAALATFLSLLATPSAFAEDCQRRVARADHRLHEAAEHHGWNSPQADHARHELQEARESCWEHNHKWWDEDAHRWHTEKDWDDHDHDRDRDHDHDH